MATEDVKYRLSVEDVAEVKAAFREILAESQRTAAGAKKNFSAVNGVLGQMKGALAGLTIGAATTALLAFARAGAAAADTLEENAEAAGATTAEYTALAAAAELNGSSADAMTTSLGKLADRIQDARDGGEQAVKTFANLGLRVSDFDGKNSAEAFELIAAAITAIPDPIERSAAAINVFGRAGSRLIPTLRAVAEQGLDGIVRSGRELGVVLDSEVVAAAARVNDELDILKQKAGAMAIVLVAELSPAVHDTFTLLAEDAEESRRAMEITGNVIGTVWRGLVFIVADFLDGVSTAAKLFAGGLLAAVGGFFATVVLAARGEFDKIPKLWETLLGQLETITEDFNQRHKLRVNVVQGRSFGGVESGSSTTAPLETNGRITPPGDPKKAFAERLAAQRSLLDAENRLLDLNLKARSDQEKARFEEGLTDLRTYYARRQALIEEARNADLKNLETERALQSANPDRAQATTAVAAIDAQIALRRGQADQEIAALAREQLDASRKLFDQRVGFEDRLAEVEGRNHQARMAAIDREVAAFALLLDQEGGLTDNDRDQKINAFGQALRAGAELDNQLSRFRTELDDVASQRASIEADVAAARISEIEGANQILAIEQARIPQLEQIAALALQAARATGDPAKIQQALDLAAAIDGLAVQVTQTQLLMANLGQEVGNILHSSIVDGLTATGDAFDSFGDRALSVLASVLDGVRRLAAEILAQKAVQALFGLFGAGAGAASSGASDFSTAGSFAGGGLIGGRGTGTSDSNLIWASRGEFYIRQAVASQPGMHAYLSAINAGRVAAHPRASALKLDHFADGGLVGGGLGPGTLAVIENLNASIAPVFPRFDALKVPRFADGGLVGAGGGSATLGGQLTVGLEDGLVERSLETRAGTRALLRVVQKNPSAFNHALGR